MIVRIMVYIVFIVCVCVCVKNCKTLMVWLPI